MEHLRTMISCPAYLRDTLSFIATGALLGAITVFGPKLIEQTIIPQELKERSFLVQHDTLLDLCIELMNKIKLNGWNDIQATNFAELSECLDLLAGFEMLVDKQTFVPWGTNYRIQYVLSELEKHFLVILNQKFYLTVLGRDICDLIDKLQEACLNIKHNVELQIQIQEVR